MGVAPPQAVFDSKLTKFPGLESPVARKRTGTLAEVGKSELSTTTVAEVRSVSETNGASGDCLTPALIILNLADFSSPSSKHLLC